MNVSIPQYRSGQFRLVSWLSVRRALSGFAVSIPQYRSGQFRRHPGRLLKIKELNGLFFQPPEGPCFFRSRALISRTSLSRNPHSDSDFRRISSRGAKMATWRWHDFVWRAIQLSENVEVRIAGSPGHPEILEVVPVSRGGVRRRSSGNIIGDPDQHGNRKGSYGSPSR